jgi:hypothetical protein
MIMEGSSGADLFDGVLERECGDELVAVERSLEVGLVAQHDQALEVPQRRLRQQTRQFLVCASKERVVEWKWPPP